MNAVLLNSEAETKPQDLFPSVPLLPREKTRKALLVASGVWLSVCSLSIWYCI